ncbi:Transcriptional regulatory protein, LuxR family protein [Nitrobacter sp. Nb-311A]|uniref:LuxR C-terminal-related transcriptional regulator n=1 Tax=Nitrobacter sp. Nb-311A TaxID=314253 RepID=UPI00006852D1|nr:helix-turn-helix transcriptional regulator [Nitrobacter sp. Nb-311A]EAQ34468.1 Transcriptional regulatory protein, LuxR family protein [Nitrobacter sp. Nb-311A]
MNVQNHALTDRQQAVCDLLIQGLSNKEISERLGISHRTVEAHRVAVFRKYGVRNVVELVRILLSTKGEVHG